MSALVCCLLPEAVGSQGQGPRLSPKRRKAVCGHLLPPLTVSVLSDSVRHLLHRSGHWSGTPEETLSKTHLRFLAH